MNKISKKINLGFVLFFLVAITSMMLVFYADNLQTVEDITFTNKTLVQGKSNHLTENNQKPLEDIIKHRSPYVSISTNKLKVDINEKSANISNVYLKDYPMYVKDCTNRSKTGKISFPILFSNDCKVNSVESGIFKERIIFHLKSISRSRGYCRKISVTFQGASQDGLSVEKTYTLVPNRYFIKSQIICTNTSKKCISPLIYHEFYRSGSNRNIINDRYSYSGYSIYDAENGYRRIPIRSINGMGNLGEISNGWIADQEPGFMSAWVTRGNATQKFYARHVEPFYIFGYTNKQYVIKPGKSSIVRSGLYVGPADYNNLFDARSDLENSWIREPISASSRIILNVLEEINQITNNWPASIVLSTLLIRALLHPLAEMGYIAGFKMERASRKIKKAQEKYKDNTNALKAETALIYKREGVNPISGLLVGLVQSPILLSLYSTIGSNIDFAKTTFLWSHDLSNIDPYFVMPAVVFLSMIMQHIIHDIYMDEYPEKSKQIPKYLISFFLGMSFLMLPVSLDIYWVTTNILSIIQQSWAFKKYSVSKNKV